MAGQYVAVFLGAEISMHLYVLITYALMNGEDVVLSQKVGSEYLSASYV